VVPGAATLVGVPAFDAVPEVIAEGEVPGRLGMIGVSEGACVAVMPVGVEETAVPVGWATPDVVIVPL
jgi:hypothetical protein